MAIAQEITPDPSTILLATGNDYPDALGAGAVAGARTGAVVLLSNDDVLTPEVRAYITAAVKKPVTPSLVAVGGQAGDAVISLQNQSFGTWTDVAGTDRYATAGQLSSEFGGMHQTVGLATGNDWPDALAGGAIAAAHNAPLLLSNGSTLPASEAAAISKLPYQAPYQILVFGGTKVVPDAAVTALEKATGRSGWVSHSNRVVPVLP